MPTAMINRKYREFNESLLAGLNFFNNDKPKYALRDYREATEAFMKILIFKHWGEDVGHGIITGILDTNGNENGDGENLSYTKMQAICEQHNLADGDILRALSILKRSNSAAHNLNDTTDLTKMAEDCKKPIQQLSKYLSEKLMQPELPEITSAFDGDQLAGSGIGLAEDPWADISILTDNFSKTNRYILVAPPGFPSNERGQLQLLSRIDWAFVLDFDPGSKESGLFSSFSPSGSRSVVHLTIKSKGQHNQVGNGGPGSTNWLHANGLNSMPDTISKNLGAWRSFKYHTFIREIMKEFFSREVHPYIFIYLWDDVEYIGELMKIWDNVELSQDLTKHIFLTTNPKATDTFKNYKNLGFDASVLPISTVTLTGKFQDLLDGIDKNEQRYLVPGRTVQQVNDIVDITDIFHRLSDDGIDVVYQAINVERSTNEDQKIPAFIQGEQIFWRDLALENDVSRYRYQELFNSVRSLLSATKRSRRFDILHKPGAGGTVLARRLAFDMRNQYPVILISKSNARTFQSLSTFLDKVNKTVLAIVEAAVMDNARIDELIREFNSRKLNVVFVYIKRTLHNEQSRDQTFFLNDSMADKLEMDKFVNLVKLYGSEEKAAKILNKSSYPSEFEVIDFMLTINEKEFREERLNHYVGVYIDKMPQSHITFLVYVCFVYYYSQKSVSYLIFRSLFKKGLTSELRHIKQSEQYIRKILVQQFDTQLGEEGEYWRPRFTKFAEVVLSHVLGQGKKDEWKDHIASYAIRFIEDFRSNNEYLVDETRDMLKVVFFGRENDLHDSNEQFQASSGDDRFSRLMSDIGQKGKQMEVLYALLDSYKNEGHFQGQLGRFIFEKAEELLDFKEAEKHIDEALISNDGKNDFNLHHIAGMCKSREIRFLLRIFRDTGTTDITEAQLKELTETGCRHFNESVRINNYNVHGYVAHLQMLMDVIDFGRELSGVENRWHFLTAANNRWYMEKYVDIHRLMETTKSLMENEETLGLSNRILRTKQYIKTSEGRALDLIGNFSASADVYRGMINTVERGYRPQMRIMVIYSILLAKVSGNKKRVDEAWALLRTEEESEIKKMLNDNVLQDPTHVLSFKLWFKLVRLSNIEVTHKELITNLRSWFENAGDSRILRTEAAFYLYVLYAMDLIAIGDSISQTARAQCKYYIEQCLSNSFNKKHVSEYLGFGKGLDALISHRGVRDIDEERFQRLDGVIATISARQEGTITLRCGLEAFFVPKEGAFVQMKDETSNVTFRLGFRPEGLVAFDVKRQAESPEIATAPLSESIEENGEMAIERLDLEILKEEESELKEETIFRNRPKLESPKVIYKIDLDKIEGSKKRNRFNNGK